MLLAEMTIFQAPEYDPRRARRRTILISVVIAAVVVVGILAWVYRYYPEERVASKFLTALRNQDYKTAYGIWIADPSWEQHPNNHPQYLFADFYRDWGPGGEWGLIRSFRIDGATRPRDGNTSSNGVVVVVTLNERKEQATIFVDPKDKSLSFSPFEVVK